ncbi:MAG: DnaD domain protein [Clostridia bacterium]|nr:DnaD domain protein [Clostridia bacterium]
MPLFQNDKSGMLWDVTSLPNGFVCEYMPGAPEGYVKVYLYGLMYTQYPAMQENQTLADVAKALSMEESEVAQAYRYWERCRLVQRIQDNPPEYKYTSVQQTLISRQFAPQDEAYMEFAHALNAIFGDRRHLHGNETVLAYEWVEQLNLPSEIVLMMIQHLISTRGVSFRFKEGQKLALELCDQHIRTVEAAEQLFSRSEAAWKGTRKVLRRMGKYRDPSLDETDLFIKWTVEWGFAPKAVESACAEMTSGDPSFAYLDKILETLRKSSGKASHSAAQTETELSSRNEEMDRIKEMLTACGIKATVIDEGRRLVYRDMLAYGDHQVVLLAAEAVGRRRGAPSLDSVIDLLASWREKGLSTAEQVKQYLQDVQEHNQFLKALYKSAGREAAPKLSDRELLQKWRQEWRFSESLLHKAAEFAKHTDKPILFMDKLLDSWHGKGIQTVEQAEKEQASHKEATASAGRKPAKYGKTVIEQQYDQRIYDPNEYDGPTAKALEEARKL